MVFNVFDYQEISALIKLLVLFMHNLYMCIRIYDVFNLYINLYFYLFLIATGKEKITE